MHLCIFFLADAFIQSDLHCIQVTVSTFYQLLLSLGIEPMILALLTPCSTSWATGKLFSYSKCSFCFRFAIVTATWKFEVVNVTRFTFSASSDISHFYFGCTLWFKSFFIFWSKCISSCLKNALNWSKVKVKAFIMLQNTSKSNKCYLFWTFYSSRDPEKQVSRFSQKH